MNVLIPVCWAVLIFLIMFTIFKRKQPRLNHLKSFYFWIWWVVLTPITYFLVVATYISILVYTPSNDFSTEAWIANPYMRTELIDDLIESKRLDGISREQVTVLLGEPEPNITYFIDQRWDRIYCLGRQRGLFGIDNEWLLIWFENNKVRKYQLRVD